MPGVITTHRRGRPVFFRTADRRTSPANHL